MRNNSHSPEIEGKVESCDGPAGDLRERSQIILKIMADAEPDGIDNDELRRLASENGIDENELNDILNPLLRYANIYFNLDKGKYHYMWSSSIQYE